MGPHHPGRERVALKIVLVGEVIQELRETDAVHQPGCKPIGLVLPKLGGGLVQEVGDVARDPEEDCSDGKYETGDWNPVDGGVGEANAEIHRQVQIVQEHVNARVPVAQMTDFMGGDTGQALDARLCVAILVQNALGETQQNCSGKNAPKDSPHTRVCWNDRKGVAIQKQVVKNMGLNSRNVTILHPSMG